MYFLILSILLIIFIVVICNCLFTFAMSKPSKPYTVNSTSTGTRHKELPTKGIIKKNSDSQSKFSGKSP